jgi:cell division protein FtsQ
MSTATAPRRGLPTGSTSVADKRFRRADVRPGRRRRVFVRVWQVGRVLLVVLAVIGAGLFVTSRAVDARILAVNDVTIRGNHRLTLGEIDALIGDVRGESLLTVDLDRFRARLLDSPWVVDVTVRRVFPSVVDVHIVERDPVAVARLGHTLYLIDGGGLIMDEYGPQYKDFDLPIVDGLAAPKSVDGPVIDPARAQLTAQFLRSLAPRPELIRALSQVDVSTDGNVVVLLGDDPTYLHLGDQLFLERIQTYLELTPALADREKPIDYVDLRFGNRVFLKDRK